jgi:GT2 family glycosyltransferase
MATKHSGAELRTMSPPQPSVAVIMVNWNGWRDTLNAYESLTKASYVNWKLIVVDNDSTDSSSEHISRARTDIILIQSDRNTGFAGGCNMAIARANALGFEYVFLLNNDARVFPNTIMDLVQATKALDDKSILGSVVRYEASGELQFFGSAKSEVWGAPHWFPPSEEAFAASPPVIESDFIFGAALFAPTSVVQRVGEFDERYFLNFEETDWCYRARRLGFQCFVVKDALTYHKGGASLGPLRGPMQTYFMARNELLFCEHHVSKLQLLRTYMKFIRRITHEIYEDMFKGPRRAGLQPRTRALALALRDYVMRRFGDCPPIIRKLAHEIGQSEPPRASQQAAHETQ